MSCPDHNFESGGNHVTCPLCARAELDRRQCKSVCQSCGYVESCEDNFIPNQANPPE